MKFSLLQYVVAGAALAQFSSASPIRITITEVSSVKGLPNGPSFIRVGHAAAFAAPPAKYHYVSTPLPVKAEAEAAGEVKTFNIPWKGVPVPAHPHPIVDGEGHALHHLPPTPMPCGRFRQTAVEVSNNIRKMLGMPLIEGAENMHIEVLPFAPPPFAPPHHGHHHNHHHDGKGPHGHPPNTMIMPGPNGPIVVATMPIGPHGAHGMHPHGHHGLHHRFSTFTMRLSAALMSLGPWEGRAVAFVLGCGLGVLIRMVFVLLLVSYRAIRGSSRSEEQPQVDYYVDFHQGGRVMLPEEDDAENILVPPPQYGYGYVEEKMPLMVAAMDQEAEEEEEEARK